MLIISRASGAPLIANALSFADELVRGGVQKIAKAEFTLADKAGLEELLLFQLAALSSQEKETGGQAMAAGTTCWARAALPQPWR